ncbi:hypothetical protein SAMN05216503_3126 [Polaribacter sp. KT25b]|uniref:hypothetical protein n=1 Tax=Polaribacter sp. KT25b TaxID=1855336 RepID=UPI000879C21E|nr:hypothetical protein [Polaribacter sp. KT25b]SDS45910.1 hypothetical protein SAMN05216503_3126 [Polaribacter sp. KT25b]
MKVVKFLVIILFGILIVSCKKEKMLQDFMVDSWQTTYLKIEMPTANKTDSLSVYEDEFDNNPDRIAQSKYNADGTFSAWFINKQGVKDSKSNGTWSVNKDTLHIEYFYLGRNVKVNYIVTKAEEGFIAKSVYDWDDDGEFDDTLIMKTKRIKSE